jgi:hypothetical protein
VAASFTVKKTAPRLLLMVVIKLAIEWLIAPSVPQRPPQSRPQLRQHLTLKRQLVLTVIRLISWGTVDAPKTVLLLTGLLPDISFAPPRKIAWHNAKKMMTALAQSPHTIITARTI